MSNDVNYKLVAHLAANNDEQGDGGVKAQKLFVTKLEAVRVESFPLEFLVYVFFL